jgi:hypothetical protein
MTDLTNLEFGITTLLKSKDLRIMFFISISSIFPVTSHQGSFTETMLPG